MLTSAPETRNGYKPVFKKGREIERGGGRESGSLFERLKLHGYVSDMGSSETTHFESKLFCISTVRHLAHVSPNG